MRLRIKRENAEEGVEAEEKRKGRKNVEIRNTGKRFQKKAARMENGGDGTFNGVEWLLREPVEAPGHGLFFWRCRPYCARVVAAVVVVVSGAGLGLGGCCYYELLRHGVAFLYCTAQALRRVYLHNT